MATAWDWESASEPEADQGGASPRGAIDDDWHALPSTIDWERVGAQLGLSNRELEVVQHIFTGQKLATVARDMHLGLGTVKTYCQRVHQKLGVTDQRELTLAVLNVHLGLGNESK